MNTKIDELMQLVDKWADERWRKGAHLPISERELIREWKDVKSSLEQALKPGEPDVMGAIINGRTYADRLENDYCFDCEAGPLRLCSDWVEFRRCFEWLAEHTAPPAQTPPPRLTDGQIEVEWEKMCGPQKWARKSVFARAIESAVRKQFGVKDE